MNNNSNLIVEWVVQHNAYTWKGFDIVLYWYCGTVREIYYRVNLYKVEMT